MNTLTVALDRECVFTLDAVQADNLTPLTITVASDLVETFGANPLLKVKFTRSDGVKPCTGYFPLATSIETTLVNTILACAGMLYAQIEITDDTGLVWQSYQSYQELSESITDAIPATLTDTDAIHYVTDPDTDIVYRIGFTIVDSEVLLTKTEIS